MGLVVGYQAINHSEDSIRGEYHCLLVLPYKMGEQLLCTDQIMVDGVVEEKNLECLGAIELSI